MSNKFLPFIVEKSTPLNIYKTLVSRSKGINTHLIASIFNIVISKGINVVRDHCKTLPNINTEAMYQDIVTTYSTHSLASSEIDLFLHVSKFISNQDRADRISEDFIEYTNQDIMIFMLVAVKNNLIAEYTDMNFDDLLNNYQEVLEHLPLYIKLGNAGVKKEFYTLKEVMGWILYTALLDGEYADELICLVLKPEEGSNAAF